MLWKTTDEHISKLGCAGLQVNGAVAFRDPFFNNLVVLLAIQDGISSVWEGRTWWGRVSEAAQHICYVPAKPQTPLITSSPNEGSDGRR